MSIQKHTAYNLAGGLLPLGLSLVTIPLYIHAIGDTRYGVLAIAWLLLGYFGLFDLGLGAATAQRMAALGDDNMVGRARVFWTALAMNCGLGIAGAMLIVPAAHMYFASSAAVSEELRPEIVRAIPWLAAALPLATISGVLTGTLQGRAQFLELNAISVGGAALVQLLPLAVAVVHGPDLPWLLAAVVLSRLIVIAVLFFRTGRHVHSAHPPSFSASEARTLLKFGGWVTISALISPLMVVLDRFVIGALLGARAVTHYTVPFQFAQRTVLIPGALSAALFPRMASVDPAQGRELATAANRSLAAVLTPLTALGVLLIQPFLAYWLNPEFAVQAGLSGALLLLGWWINAFAHAPLSLLQAAGRPDAVAKCHLMELVPYLALLYAGLRYFGIPGAAVVFGLRTLVDCALLMHFTGILARGIEVVARPAILLLLVFAFSRLYPAEASAAWIASTVFVLVIVSAWSLRAAPPELRQLVGKRRQRV